MTLATLPALFDDGRRLAFRPATGAGPDLKRPSDPVNLIFLGEADPLRIRTALLALQAERDPKWHVLAGRNARWRDAIGHIHTVFVADHGWSASAVQLELGRYKRARAHLRLFAYEGFTLAAAHVEFLPTGGFEHEVVSWELGEELVVSELLRAGLLADAPARIGPFETGLDRRIEADTLRAAPEGLASLAGLSRLAVAPTKVPGAGYLTALNLAPLPPAEGERSWTRVWLDLSTDVRRPCSGDERMHIRGPLSLEQELFTGSGNLSARLAVRGSVTVDGTQVGEVSEGQITRLCQRRTRAALLGDYQVMAKTGSRPTWRRRVRARLTSGGEPSHRIGRDR